MIKAYLNSTFLFFLLELPSSLAFMPQYPLITVRNVIKSISPNTISILI